MKQITSIQNALVKALVQLQEKSKVRKQTQTFVIEGKREIALAIKGGYHLKTVLFVPELISEAELDFYSMNSEEQIVITKEVYHKLAYRESTEGILAIATMKSLDLNLLKLPDNPLIVVLESLEKPGNLGAILRSCDAARVDAVIIADSKTDLFNSNTIRSSVGCLFTNQMAVATSLEAIQFLKSKDISIFSATLQNSNSYHEVDYRVPTALVVGTEATGLTSIWREHATKNIIIPMQGVIDSMNVSVATAILIFEAKRQRGF
ncbi:TrmH family RNA methyltransferase [Flavobacterium aciduliphilum]|uniref:TrmH family RNA methyltransferase n=1 Tax=Flavobacterium aciduliphilum TaxID=1101402 RepID=A0A328YQA3_9FLAO|nr:RNA methyltransferase [Flavobacterium aciduliphilum]RAR75323.1 TrmH family RNA methyltransferase [Flavobacterium aciduliphilum]